MMDEFDDAKTYYHKALLCKNMTHKKMYKEMAGQEILHFENLNTMLEDHLLEEYGPVARHYDDKAEHIDHLGRLWKKHVFDEIEKLKIDLAKM